MFSVYSLEEEWNRYSSTYGGTVGYGGAQAGTGVGGVDGAGVITRGANGAVGTGNNTETRYVQPDGTVVLTGVIDGSVITVNEMPDGTKITSVVPPVGSDRPTITIREMPDGTEITSVSNVIGDNTITSFLVKPDGTVGIGFIQLDSNGNKIQESQITQFADGRVIRTLSDFEQGDREVLEYAADGRLLHRMETWEGGLVRDARLLDNGFVSVRWSYPVGYFDTHSGDSFREDPDAAVDAWARGLDAGWAQGVGDIDSRLAGGQLTEVASVTQKAHDGKSPSLHTTVTGTYKHDDGRTETIIKNYTITFHKDRPVSATPPSGEAFTKGLSLIQSMIDMLMDPKVEGQSLQKRGVMELRSELETYFVNALVGTGSADILSGDGVLAGGAGNDSLIGASQQDLLLGGIGSDVLTGGGGNDLLYGDVGNDTLVGGAATDHL